MSDIPGLSGPIDFHKAITKKERSSRYIRTAFDYLVQVQGEDALNELLREVGIERDSSIFKHIYDDENWNSYELEVFLYEKLKDRFEDPYQAIWQFGIASGSGRLDQKDTLFAFKLKIAPVPVILRKVSEHTERVTLVSECNAEILKTPATHIKNGMTATISFKYSRLPENFQYPSWTSVVAGYAIVYATMRYRKGLDFYLKITHWPNLPSDLPSVDGKVYVFDKTTKNISEKETGKIVGNAKDGPFEIDGVVWNNGVEAIAWIEWERESLAQAIAKLTIHRKRLKKEEELRVLRSEIVEELSAQHQKQLAAYEKELTEKARLIQAHLEKIHELKIQQDGDYFLTSLLTSPMIANRNRSDAVQTEIHVEQKKKFEFRKWKSELGGDTCLTDQVILRGRQYSVFLNGDAMGKSLQGAGGAIVLGVVFNTYLNRSRFSSYQKQKSPELWLRDAALDLQNAYLSFQGSMYVSLVMGLIDETSGVMYFINAEHPWMVLYRDGKASFIGDELLLRKLGTPGMEDQIRINTFQLKPGDSILMGSDGRDDLEIGHDGSNRVINEDETIFLKVVEESGGNVETIVENIKKQGSITDDLSLLKVTFFGSPANMENANAEYKASLGKAVALGRLNKLDEAIKILHSLYRNHPDRVEPLRYLGRLQFKQKDYPAAAETLTNFFEQHQDESGVQYLISRASKKAGDLKAAIDFGERCMLREPEHLNNLINLADAYRLSGNTDRARQLVTRAVSLSPDHAAARKLADLMDRS